MAGKGKGALRIAIEDFLETFKLGELINKWFKEWSEKQELEIVKIHQDLFDELKKMPDLPDVLKQLANLKAGDDLQGGALTGGAFAMSIGTSAASGLFAPYMNKIGQQAEKRVRSQIADIGTLFGMMRRGLIPEPMFYDHLERNGWSDEYIEIFKTYTLQLLGVGDNLTLWRRGEIGDIEFEQRLLDQGWSEESIQELKELTEVIPGVGDLINMAVKEAFNPEIVSKFGYDKEFPDEVGVWAAKQGLSLEWAHKFWYAHWLTPSIGQGFEMLHRLRPGVGDNTFVESDMRELLKILDVPIYWRDKLIDISYNPLTRVDVRRMHDLGNLDEQGVKDAYLDSGYNEKNAQLMTDFTLDYNKEPIKLLSKEVVLRAYKKGMFSESEAIDILVTAGWTTEQATFYLNMAMFDMLEKETDLQTDLIHDQYLAGEIDKPQVHRDLNTLNLPNTQTERLLKEWELEKIKKIRLPTEGELESWYKLDYITDESYRSGLVDKNYKSETIDLYIRQADQDISEKLQKLELDLMDAKEKLQLDLMASDYRKAQLNLSLLMAQEKSNIAELKVIAHDIEDEEILEQLKARISLIKLIITGYQVEKAELKLSEEMETQEEE